MRTQLNRIIGRAGLTVWPKLFQNLHSTRQTELAEEFPSHVVCQWIGNSQNVAAKHYLQVTDDHYSKATQKATQHASKQLGTAPHSENQNEEKPGKHCKSSVSGLSKVAETGLEQGASNRSKTTLSQLGAAVVGINSLGEQEINQLLSYWAKLPKPTRLHFMKLIQTLADAKEL